MSAPLPPHAGQPVLRVGAPLGEASVGVILLHGRGAAADDIIGLGKVLDAPGVHFAAPQAAERSWYPRSFLAPIEENAAGVASARSVLAALVGAFAVAGIPPERTVLVGFSQGACLACDFAGAHRGRLGGVAALTGGLIGPPGAAPACTGALDGTPVYLGASDPDAHVPFGRVEETATALRAIGAEVDTERFPGAPHAILTGHIRAVRGLIASLLLS